MAGRVLWVHFRQQKIARVHALAVLEISDPAYLQRPVSEDSNGAHKSKDFERILRGSGSADRNFPIFGFPD